MPLFNYQGLNTKGKNISGTIEAQGRRVALAKLKEQQIYATRIMETTATLRSRPGSRSIFPRRKVSSSVLGIATRQLAILLSAGIALDDALGTIREQIEDPRLHVALAEVRDAVIQGDALHEALCRHPLVFPSLFTNMVHAGESSGTLDQVMARLADFLEEQARLRNRIQAALAYPILMALVGGAVLFFLISFVVPRVTRMLDDMGETLPLPTRLLIALSDFMSQYWWLLILMGIFAFIASRRYAATEAGRLFFDRLKLRMPLFGKLSLQVSTAQLSRTLSTLLHSGVPLLSALEITRNLVNNRVLSDCLDDTAIAVREGEGLSSPLARSGVFPPMLAQMVAVGEKSGTLEEMLAKVADAFENQVETTIAGLLSLLEPIMILVMGVLVGFIVLSILLPIFQASSGFG